MLAGLIGRDGGVLETYRLVSSALERAMADLGVRASAECVDGARRPTAPGVGGPACFDAASPHEITVEGRGMLGIPGIAVSQACTTGTHSPTGQSRRCAPMMTRCWNGCWAIRLRPPVW